ncbi:MAG: CapA family protein [Betaproteobacteria bacterium]|nr:CapA family protein [Betaproteobacteria bacterium]
MKRWRSAVRALALSLWAAGAACAEPVSIVFAGDIMLDEGPGRVIASGRDPLRHFAAYLIDADFTVGNLECPIATIGLPLDSKIYLFRAHPRVLSVLRERFDAVSVANNHSGDYGKQAFLQTLGLLDEAGIRHFGGGRDLAAAHAPLWVEKKGLRIALLGYNEFKPRAFEAGPDWPGIAWSEDSQVVADIRAARAAGADLVIPFMHWGWEREPRPSERQRQLARVLIDAGADAVVGAHPHITQGAEIYKGRPIIYSLGNFVFDGFKKEALRTGWLLRLTMDRGGVLAWETRAARADAEGTPHPVPGALTPCWRAGEAAARECRNP